jgi:hypothetical protein
MSDLASRIRSVALFDETKLPPPYDMGGDNTDESAVFRLGAQAENARLAPLIEALADAIEKLRLVGHRSEPENEFYDNNIHRCVGFLDCCEEVIADTNEALTRLNQRISELE